MRNLVTGASGFLGGHLVEGLLLAGEEVVALVRRSSNRSHLDSLGVTVIEGDLQDRDSVWRAVDGVDRVFNCAALVSDWGDWADFRAANVVGLKNLLEASDERGVQLLLHVSTTDVYGYPDRPVDESAPFRRRGMQYGDTKIEAEELLWNFAQDHDLPVTVVRPASLYGPRSQTLVHGIVELLQAGDLPLLGSADHSAGLTEVTNAVSAILLVASSKQSVGRAYNLTDDSPVTWKTYFERLAKMVDAPPPRRRIPRRVAYVIAWLSERTYRVLRQPKPSLPRIVVELFGTEQGFSIDRLRTELGYEPKVDFEEGMRRVEESLQAGN